MEVAIVECSREDELDQVLPSSYQFHVFCIPRGDFSPPQGLKALSKTFDLSNGSGRCYAFFLGDFELGFIVGRLALEHQVTFYTHRSTIESFQYVNVKVKRLSEATRGRESPSPQPSECPEEASFFLRQVEEKYRASFLLNPLTRAAKKASVLAQMRNIAEGVLGSYRSRGPFLMEICPSSEDLAERLYEDLRRKGVLVERLGQVEYLVQGVQTSKPVVSAPNTQRLTTGLKLDTLHKYMEKFLLQPGVRAIKEKSARAQLTNLAKGGVTAIRTKHGANVDIPTEEIVSLELFDSLVARKVILLEGLNVQYSDEAIEELANDTAALESLCEGRGNEGKTASQPDLKTAILREALGKYYQKFLLSSLTAAKTTKGVKEQIKNFVQGSVTSAAKSHPDLYRVLPSVDDLTDRLYRLLLTRKVVVTVGSGVRYSQDAIDTLERDMAEMTLWEEEEEPQDCAGPKLQGAVEKQVLAQCREYAKLTLGAILELAKRSVMSTLAFKSGSKSSASVPSVAKEVLFSLLDSEELHLPPSSPSLQALKASFDRYSSLEVTIGDVEDDGPGA